MTPLALSVFGHMLLVGAFRFEDRFCASRKGGTNTKMFAYYVNWGNLLVGVAVTNLKLPSTVS